MRADRDKLTAFVGATILGAGCGICWWAMCNILFDFQDQVIWLPLFSGVITANLILLTLDV
jgi:hypothetical protein